MQPEFSIILPVHNRERVLSRAMTSVLKQTFENWELIVIDDGSTDASLKVAHSFVDSRIKVIAATPNGGAAKARNLGITASQGRFISFLDSDDEFAPEFLSASFSKLSSADGNYGLLWTGVRYHRTAGGKDTVVELMWTPHNQGSPYLTFLGDLRIGTNSGITVRREVIDRVGAFDERLPAAEDTDLFLRIAKEFSFDSVPKYLINIYQNKEDRLSRRFDKIAIAYNLIIPKHMETIEHHGNLRSKFFYKAMWLNYHLGNKSLSRKYFKRLLRENPFHIKAWFIWLLFETMGQRIGATLHQQLGS